jgi:hypothetical protein
MLSTSCAAAADNWVAGVGAAVVVRMLQSCVLVCNPACFWIVCCWLTGLLVEGANQTAAAAGMQIGVLLHSTLRLQLLAA